MSNQAMHAKDTIEQLLTRRSVLVKEMHAPGPDSDQLDTLLKAAHRVPDHGKLGPWRFIVFNGDARQRFGLALEKICVKQNPEVKDELREFQRNLLMRAPLVIGVISSIDPNHKVPVWEQELSVGASCQNILLAASAMGFGAQWLTEWYSFNQDVDKVLGLKENERMAGFIYVGSFTTPPKERVRPELSERVVYW